jgi:hypothetical protein
MHWATKKDNQKVWLTLKGFGQTQNLFLHYLGISFIVGHALEKDRNFYAFKYPKLLC